MADEMGVGEKQPENAVVRLVDSHCHIDMPQFDADREEVVARAREAGLAEMLVVGGVDEAEGHRRALAVAERFGLPATAGVHPHEARFATEAVYDELRGLAREGRIVAIGEIGLDFHYDHSPRDVQRDAFRRQIRLAREVSLPIVVHTREADAETADILDQEGASEAGGVVHCFTGGLDLARRALDLGFLISFSGIVAFPRAEVIPGGAGGAGGPPPGRDGRPVPGPAPAPGKEERARLRGGRGAQGGGPAGDDSGGAQPPRAGQLRTPVPPRDLTRDGFDNAPRIRHFNAGVPPGPVPTEKRHEMADSSFDIVSSVDLQEVKNAIAQATKEIQTRYDLKSSGSSVELTGEEMLLSSSDEFKLKAVREVLEQRLVKRNVPLKALTFETIESALGGTVRQKVTLQKGIPTDKAREIVKVIKGTKLKVQAAIQGDQLRVSGKSKDDLQTVMQVLKNTDLGIDMQFTNRR
jgi:TatD family hydrolase